MNITIRDIIKQIYDKYLICQNDAKNDYNDFIKNNNEYIERDSFFYFSAEVNNIDYAKMLIQFEGLESLSPKKNKFFQQACYHGNIEFAEWLLQIFTDIDISSDDDFALKWSIIRTHKKIYDWLLNLKEKDFNLIKISEFVFEMSCHHDNLYSAKWMFEINPNISFIKNPIYHFLRYDKFDKYDLNENDKDVDSDDNSDDISLSSYNSDLSMELELIDNPISVVFSRHFLNLSRWLYEIISPQIKFTPKEAESILFSSCIKDNLDFSKWFYSIIDKSYVKYFKINDFFEKTILYKRFEVLKWLFEIFPDVQLDYSKIIMNTVHNDISSYNTVNNNDELTFNIFQYLFSKIIDKNMKNQIDYKELFLRICSFGNSKLLNFIIDLGYEFDIDYENYKPFYYACLCDNIDMAKYLLEKYPNIDISLNNDFIIKNCIMKDSNLNTIRWLANLLPNRYSFYDDDKKLLIKKNTSINNDIENNFNNHFDDDVVEYDFSHFTYLQNESSQVNGDDYYKFNYVLEYKNISDDIILASEKWDENLEQVVIKLDGILDDLSDYEDN